MAWVFFSGRRCGGAYPISHLAGHLESSNPSKRTRNASVSQNGLSPQAMRVCVCEGHCSYRNHFSLGAWHQEEVLEEENLDYEMIQKQRNVLGIGAYYKQGREYWFMDWSLERVNIWEEWQEFSSIKQWSRSNLIRISNRKVSSE